MLLEIDQETGFEVNIFHTFVPSHVIHLVFLFKIFHQWLNSKTWGGSLQKVRTIKHCADYTLSPSIQKGFRPFCRLLPQMISATICLESF